MFVELDSDWVWHVLLEFKIKIKRIHLEFPILISDIDLHAHLNCGITHKLQKFKRLAGNAELIDFFREKGFRVTIVKILGEFILLFETL